MSELARQEARGVLHEQECAKVHNVNDPWRGWIGSWEVEPFDYAKLSFLDVDRRVIYLGKPAMWRTDLGLISSWRDGIVFVRFGRGFTAAGCNPRDLCFAALPCDGVAFPIEETYRVAPASESLSARQPDREAGGTT